MARPGWMRRALAGALGGVALLTAACAPVVESTASTAGYRLETGSLEGVSADGRFTVFSGPYFGDSREIAVYRHDNVSGTTDRVTRFSDGRPALGYGGPISRSGRLVAFSTRDALVPEDTNGVSGDGMDVYVRDMSDGTLSRVSLRPDGTQFTTAPEVEVPHPGMAMSGTGRYVAFVMFGIVYLRDRGTQTTQELVRGTAAYGGVSIAGMSDDGLHVAIQQVRNCDSDDCPEIQSGYVIDWNVGTSWTPAPCPALGRIALSADGRYAAARSRASFGPGCEDAIFRFDRVTNTRKLLGESPSGQIVPALNPSISADGARVAYTANLPFTTTPNLPEVAYVEEVASGDSWVVGADVFGGPLRPTHRPLLSADGTAVAFTWWQPGREGDPEAEDRPRAFTAPAVRPEITRIVPSSVARGASDVVVRVDGHGLAGPISGSFGPGITVTNTQPESSRRVRFTISVAPDAVTGTRDVTVATTSLLGVARWSCPGCLTVTP